MKLKKIFKFFGPGLVTGASDDDPSGIATYTITGAQFGYTQLWVALLTFPCMLVVQQLCGKIGLCTGKGLSKNIRKTYGIAILSIVSFLLLIANIINIGADLGAMASSAQLILHFSFHWWLILITTVSIVLQVFIPYKVYSKFLKYLALSLFTYVISAFIVKVDWKQVAIHSVIPSIIFSKEYFMNIVALMGTTISPYLFFWQTGQELEELVDQKKIKHLGQGKPKFTEKDKKIMRIDTAIGMLFSNVIMWFIIITASATFAVHGIHNIETADQAALALKPLAGNFAFLLFAIGIIGTGLLGIPILAGSVSYAIAEIFDWKEGLYRKLTHAGGFYAIIIAATILGFVMINTNIKPFKLLYYSAVLNGLIAPLVLFLIMLLTNNKKIMGKHTNSWPENIIGWATTGLMTLGSILLLVYI
jgi:NRAMP (natural resistance-associated macrophage protein)-like metal ion transporter